MAPNEPDPTLDPTLNPTPDDTDGGTGDGDGDGDTIQVLVPTALHSPAWEIGRRVLIVLAIGFGVFLLAVAANRDDTTIDAGTGDERVVTQFPPADGQAPRQTQVGVELTEGFTGVLAINGTPIPEEQLDGARDPASMTSDDLKQYGIRPNNRNRLFFTPGPGKVFESIPLGEVTVTVNYYRDRQEAVDPGGHSWTFTVQ